MKQIIQSFKTGETLLEEVPAPLVEKGSILVQTSHSLVSLGTEKMLVEFGKSSLISKARQQPDKVKQVIEKISSDGLIPTVEAVFKKLEEPLPLGYCNVGRVIAIGQGVNSFKIGDRVASNGSHAEYVSVPQNLATHIPENVSDEEATFTVVGSIGLQGLRLLNPTFGENVVVIGLGLIGLLTAQLLVGNGCNVIGIDVDDDKLKLAKTFGIKPFNPTSGDQVKFVEQVTGGIGADGVIITASTKTNDIISASARMCRKRGRIVLIGVVGLNLSRAEFYEKELTFQVSCSYGPGRYDSNYEQNGYDYPLPFVRWTEKRNFDSMLNSISRGIVDVKKLISEVIPFEEYYKIYQNIGQAKSIASILQYKNTVDLFPSRNVVVNSDKFINSKGIIGIVGSGNFTKMTLLPILKKQQIKYIASRSGLTGTSLARKYGITNSTTDYTEILRDSDVDLIIITTRHNLHAKMVIEGLKSKKNVFVEKPLALNYSELEDIIEAYHESGKMLTVGFNRRFSPHIQKIKEIVGNAQMNVVATMNAGFIPSDSWVHDLQVGGGRIVGEACHYIDLISYLTGGRVIAVCMNSMGVIPKENSDNVSILLKYDNGSTGIINYFSNGSKSYSKERIEVFSNEGTLIMDNFIKTVGYGIKGFSNLKTTQDKGHKAQFDLLLQRLIEGGEALIPFDEIVNTTRASLAALESLKSKSWIEVKL